MHRINATRNAVQFNNCDNLQRMVYKKELHKRNTAQKMKLSTKDFFSKWDQIRSTSFFMQ